MTEHKLSEQELQEIREEAEKLYPLFDINECTGPIDMEKKNGVVFLVRNTHIAALTRERERVKPIIELLQQYIWEQEESYCVQKDEADWYNNNMPGVGQTLEYKSCPSLPKMVEEAKILLNNYQKHQ